VVVGRSRSEENEMNDLTKGKNKRRKWQVRVYSVDSCNCDWLAGRERDKAGLAVLDKNFI
jgi:hypothetical protein